MSSQSEPVDGSQVIQEVPGLYPWGNGISPLIKTRTVPDQSDRAFCLRRGTGALVVRAGLARAHVRPPTLAVVGYVGAPLLLCVRDRSW